MTDVELLNKIADELDAGPAVQESKGVGWIPRDSLKGAAHYIRHRARLLEQEGKDG